MYNELLWAGLFSVGVNLLMFVWAYVKQTDKLTDVSYSLTFLALVFWGLARSTAEESHVVVAALVVLWAIRLGTYLLIRIIHKGRDKRFDGIREKPISFMSFWVMQGLTCFVVSLPFLLIMQIEDVEWAGLSSVFIVLAVCGLLLESVADYQKFNFKKKNPERFMKQGLWAKVRHPNYTGELLFWASLFGLCYGLGAPLWSVIGPIWIGYILIGFSGIPPLEKRWKSKYRDNPEFQKHWNSSWRIIPFIY